jgi:nicotinate dehydrogenase subunit B
VDWASYPILRFPEAPAIEVILIERRDQPLWGAGEAAAVPVAAALGNAVFDATGVRLRRVPFSRTRVADALRVASGFSRKDVAAGELIRFERRTHPSG